MNTRCLLLLFVSLWVLPASLTAADSKVSWHFDIKDDQDGIPRGKVFLEVDGKRHLIDNLVTGNHYVMTKADYKAKNIPDDALTACRFRWAHVIKQFYAIRKDDKVQVFIRGEDEEGGFIGEYELIKSLP